MSAEWTRDRVLFGYHSGYMETAWKDLPNTFAFGDKDGGKDGRRGLDGVKVFSGWAKHPTFKERQTGWRDTVSQGCSREYRSHDWWFMPGREELLPSGKGTVWGDRIAGFDWGSATGWPGKIEENVCGIVEGGYVAC